MNTRTAIALSYTESVDAPFIIAKGKNELADRMLLIAKENGIQIVSDHLLADVLADTEIGSCIPIETYQAVASIFAFFEKGIKDDWF